MANTTIRQWVEQNGAAPCGRVAKRIARFAGNTTDPETSLAAQQLLSMIDDALPKKEKSDATN